MAIIEIDLSDELEARLKRVADRSAVSLPEMAKYILAEQLAREKTIDWMRLVAAGRESLARIARILQEAKK